MTPSPQHFRPPQERPQWYPTWLRFLHWRNYWWLAVVVVGYSTWPVWTARVVNVIPMDVGAEARQNPEPTLAVDPTNSNLVIATAMRLGDEGDECDALVAPVVESTDQGKTWELKCALELRGDPLDTYSDYLGDPSVDIAGSGATAVGAYLTPGWEWHALVVQSDLTSAARWPSTVVQEFKTTDQPHVAANHGPAENDYAISASVDESTSSCMPDDSKRDAVVYTGLAASLTPTCFLERSVAMEMPAVRSAWHSSGTVYTVFYRPTDTANRLTDVVVVKGTRNTAGAINYAGPVDGTATGDTCGGRDGLLGFRLARCVTYPWKNGNDPQFGQERRRLSHLSTAVDPKNADIVYVAWGDSLPGSASRLTLHVRASFDGGATWDTADRFSVDNSTNPVLAVNDDGDVGFAYQQLADRAGEKWWDTVFILANADFTKTEPFRLAETKTAQPVGVTVPYLGDYMDLVARGGGFFGVFSASNDFATSVFPFGVVYARTPPGSPVSPGSPETVPISIDPYFFAIETQPRWLLFVRWITQRVF